MNSFNQLTDLTVDSQTISNEHSAFNFSYPNTATASLLDSIEEEIEFTEIDFNKLSNQNLTNIQNELLGTSNFVDEN